MAPNATKPDDGTDTKTVTDLDTSFKCGTEAPAQVADGVPKWYGLCADDSKCGRDATRLVEVGGVSVMACGHHVEEAAEAAADAAEVALETREPTTSAPDSADYDVSETLDALRERADDADDLARCDDCETAIVPDGDGGQTCPRCSEPRGPDGEVPATDGSGEGSDLDVTGIVPVDLLNVLREGRDTVLSVRPARPFHGWVVETNGGGLSPMTMTPLRAAGYRVSGFSEWSDDRLRVCIRPEKEV